MDRSLVGGVVLTGGGARLAAMCDMAEGALGWQARNGLPVGIEDWPAQLDHPGWAAAAGPAMYSAKLKVHGELERQSVGLPPRILWDGISRRSNDGTARRKFSPTALPAATKAPD